MRFVETEGFLRYEKETPRGEFVEVTLTLRGLAVLGYIPVSIRGGQQKQPLIHKLKRGLTLGAGTAAQKTIELAVGKAFELMMMGGIDGPTGI